MPTWVTHMMVADTILTRFPGLDRRGFCAGSIAPDCNIENEDWTAYTPPREITHWMQGKKKTMSDCDAFRDEYLLRHLENSRSSEESSFLLGYYAHLITDVVLQIFLRHPDRVAAAWRRVRAREDLRQRSAGMEENWDSIIELFSKEGVMRDIYDVEAEYLQGHPDSGYFTEILPLKEFPDYIGYMPDGCIVRKIGVMGYMPQRSAGERIAISREEYLSFVDNAVELTVKRFREII